MQNPIRFPRFDTLMIPIMLLALLGLYAGLAGAAQEPVVWSCGYDRETSIACRLRTPPLAASTEAPDATASSLPIDDAQGASRRSRLPAIVRELRERPGLLSGRTVLIPLHTEPTDMAFVRQLAAAVMCGARADCRVDFAPGRTELAQMAPQDLVDRTDAALDDSALED